jgi:hypothetical protein
MAVNLRIVFKKCSNTNHRGQNNKQKISENLCIKALEDKTASSRIR